MYFPYHRACASAIRPFSRTRARKIIMRAKFGAMRSELGECLADENLYEVLGHVMTTMPQAG